MKTALFFIRTFVAELRPLASLFFFVLSLKAGWDSEWTKAIYFLLMSKWYDEGAGL